jgi:UDP-N-acetylglucosamine diphosphorylase/glucosamine-1-phosphate N-acetyltransferase
MTDNPEQLAAIVLAAGKGKRMKSDLPKVLHVLSGKPLVEHVLDTLSELSVSKAVVVVGYKAGQVEKAIARPGVTFVLQKKQLGTGHAVQMAERELTGFEGDTIVLAGDVPLLRSSTVAKMIDVHRETGAVATVLTAKLPDPIGYGRIIRDGNSMVRRIVEHKDASDEERKIDEINTGTFIFQTKPLFEALRSVDNDNSQGEYYLTDVMQVFMQQGFSTAAYCAEDYRETIGVNSPDELAQAESLMGQRVLS